MAIVFRVESETTNAPNTMQMGMGVYSCEAGQLLAEGQDERHPLPQYDMKLSQAMSRELGFSGIHFEFNFCFESEEALVRWFSGLRKESTVRGVQQNSLNVTH